MKKIYQNFTAGLSKSDRQGPEGSYYIGREVDPYINPGYITPGWTPTALSGTALVTNNVVGITDVLYTGNQTTCYGIDDGGNSGATSARVYAFNTDTNTVTDDTNFPHDIATEVGRGITMYEAKAASGIAPRLFYVLDGTVGRFDFSGNFDDDYMTNIPVGGEGFQSSDAGNEYHPHLKWKSYLWIGDGRYLAKYDGQDGDGGEGTWEATKFDIGSNWHITALFDTKNYIGICATEKRSSAANPTEDKYRARSKVFFYDGDSAEYTYSLDIGDNIIRSAINNNGIVQLFTAGRQAAGTIKILGDQGAETAKYIRHDISGTETNFDAPPLGAVDIYRGKTILGSNNQNIIMSYGREEIGQPYGLTFPYADYSVSASQIGALRTVNEDKIYFGDKKGTTYNMYSLSTGASTDAEWRGLYTDMGQKIRINYIKFYFKTMTTSDAVTPSIDVDYGTNWTLRDPRGNATITEALDGTATSKRFDVRRECHSFRPVIKWDGGAVAFSKVVIDYQFVEDK